jgi:hypothetical protein
VLFADGTGNAFTKQESNVWRLYEALDRTKPDQVAYHSKGVGTASWIPFAALDGATGIGVPSQCPEALPFPALELAAGRRDRHLRVQPRCLHGADTRRAISSQRLVLAEIDGVPVSHAEMQRNAMPAWPAESAGLAEELEESSGRARPEGRPNVR